MLTSNIQIPLTSLTKHSDKVSMRTQGKSPALKGYIGYEISIPNSNNKVDLMETQTVALEAITTLKKNTRISTRTVKCNLQTADSTASSWSTK